MKKIKELSEAFNVTSSDPSNPLTLGAGMHDRFFCSTYVHFAQKIYHVYLPTNVLICLSKFIATMACFSGFFSIQTFLYDIGGIEVFSYSTKNQKH